ncbi:hypothetical protein BKA93DRAFT_829618 [Sparassis latifolia]
MTLNDALGPPPVLILETDHPPQEPPPPYPSRDRRTRPYRSTRRRRTIDDGQSAYFHHLESDHDSAPPPHDPFFDADDHEAAETTPLLHAALGSPTARPAAAAGRQRTLSITSTLRSSGSAGPSFVQTVVSAFRPELDGDLDPCEDLDREREREDGALESPPVRLSGEEDERARAFAAGPPRSRAHTWAAGWRRYFRPLRMRAYYAALFHLLVLNFPYALVAWVYIFVFTVAGTTSLMALPLGAVLCFLDLVGARTLARGELALQTTFHGPLAYPPPHPPLTIFTRTRAPTLAEAEAGLAPGPVRDHSFYRNAYAMFADPTSYQALFYFLVIKPGITVLLSLGLVLLVPAGAALVLPAPAVLRLARRLGIWQANVAVEGLYFTVR